jgi:hypothetical protein
VCINGSESQLQLDKDDTITFLYRNSYNYPHEKIKLTPTEYLILHDQNIPQIVPDVKKCPACYINKAIDKPSINNIEKVIKIKKAKNLITGWMKTRDIENTVNKLKHHFKPDEIIDFSDLPLIKDNVKIYKGNISEQ